MIIEPGVTIGGAITIFDPTIPTQGNVTAWTDATYANIASVGSGVLTSSQAATNDTCWQLFYAYQTITIPAQANGIGLNVYAGDSNSWTWYITIGGIPGINNFYGTPTVLGTGTCVSTSTGAAGAFVQSTITNATTIPAGSYFMIATVNAGPFYKTFQAATQNKTFAINGVPYVTALNTVYISSSSTTQSIPYQVGGTDHTYTTTANTVAVMGVVFQ